MKHEPAELRAVLLVLVLLVLVLMLVLLVLVLLVLLVLVLLVLLVLVMVLLLLLLVLLVLVLLASSPPALCMGDVGNGTAAGSADALLENAPVPAQTPITATTLRTKKMPIAP